MDMLNSFLQSPYFERLLYSLENYIVPEYSIPNKAKRKTRKDENGNEIKDENGNPIYDNYIELLKDEKKPSDYRQLLIDESFVENAAMLEIQKNINHFKYEYLQSRLVQ